MLAIVVIAVVSWEIYLRNQGVDIAYDDGTYLWSDKRAMVYEPSDKTIVFIGSSRIKFDLDIPTWERQTGIHAVQLAIEGSSPRPVLEDLANDPKFKGRLVVDVTEGLFFSNAPPNTETPNENIKFYHERTPAQQASFYVNKALESQLVFLDKDNYSLNAQLTALEIPSRPGVFMMPIFPMEFGRKTFERQTYMTPKFVADTLLHNRVRGVWAFFAEMGKGAPPMPDAELNGIFESVKTAVNKIKARGGEVFFVRTPSSGPLRMGEKMAFPREKLWDKLLTFTDCKGIHFEDDPVVSKLICPEFSHLTPSDAVIYTKYLIEAMKKETGWKLSANNNTPSN